jgi:hypothetical protein
MAELLAGCLDYSLAVSMVALSVVSMERMMGVLKVLRMVVEKVDC